MYPETTKQISDQNLHDLNEPYPSEPTQIDDETAITLTQKQSPIDKISSVAGTVGGALLIACAFVIVWEIVSRSVFGKPTVWAFELSIYLFMLFVFISMASLQSRNGHIQVDLITSMFCPRTKAIWDVVTLCCSLAFAVLLFTYGIKFAGAAYKIKEISPSYWGPPVWPIKLMVPVGALLLCLQYAKDIYFLVGNIKNTSLKSKPGWFQNPYIIGGLFTGLVGLSIILFHYEPISAFVILMLTLLLFGVQIFTALGLVGAIGFFLVFGGANSLITVPKIVYGSMESFSIVCIPLFVICGEMLNRAGAGQELYDMAAKWLDRFEGGLAISTILACTIFAAISASSVATALTIGLVALPALRKHQYDKTLSYGTVAAGGTLGIMIPPSGSMIIYSAVTEESLGRLFIAGIVPGIILMILFSFYIVVYQKYFATGNTATHDRVKLSTTREKFASIYEAKWALLAPVIIIGGIYTGLFTPLEAAAVAVVYSLVMILCRGKIKAKDLPSFLRDSSGSAASILVIIFGAMIMGHYMTMLNLPNLVIGKVMESGLSNWGVIFMLMVGFMVMGMFLEVISIMLITLPIVYPLIISLGFDGIWFAVLMTLNMELALITPPVGLNLFVIQGIEKAELSTILKGVWPFFILMLIGLLLVCLFPELSTWLPQKMMG